MVKTSYVPIQVWWSTERFFETPHDRPPKYALMITIYLDESRYDNRDKYMVVAGFWGNKEQWEGLIPDWIAGLGKRKSLHMRTLRLNSERGAKRARPLLKRLGALPYKHGLTPIYAAVKAGDYFDIIANTAVEERLPGYVICLTGVISLLSRSVPPNESIKIVCEIQKSYEERAALTFRQLRASHPISQPSRPFFSGIEFIPKDSSVLTQPSDFLAYAIAEGHEKRNSQKSELCSPILGPRQSVTGMTLPREDIRGIISRTKNFMLAKMQGA
jgi:hypothetical protein